MFATFPLLAVFSVLVVFVADALSPLGVASSVGYVVAVTLCTRSAESRPVYAVAGIGSVLALLALAVKLGTADWAIVAANRALALLAIWVTAWLVIAAQRRAASMVAAERERSRSATLLASTLAHGPDGMLLVQTDGRIQMANPAAGRIFGWADTDLVGRPIDELVPPNMREQHAEHRQHFGVSPEPHRMAGGRAVHGLRKDGTEAMVECVVARAGVDDLLIVSVRDVSERHRYEERHRAAQRLEAIGRLAGGIAHDFNNLLAVIVSGGEYLDRTPLDINARTEVNDILAAARRGAGLTKQLLAFSRRQIISPRRLDVNQLVRDMKKMLSRILGEDIDLISRLGEQPCPVEMDPSQVEQILLNLVVNARDAMPKGGKLTLETANLALDETYARSHPDVVTGDYVVLAVSDTGVGMTDDVRVRIFEPFFTTKGPTEGSGLGLATVYGIVRQAEGHIWVYSEPGAGTTFRVYLPRVDGPPDPVITHREVVRPRGGSERILVVEDDPPVRRVIVRTLRGAGYEVVEAANGVDALKKIEALEGDLALMVTDVVMPQMGGREAAQRVAARYPGVRVLFLSGYTENAIVHRGVLDPGLVFLEKPFRDEDLLRRVRELLDSRERA